MNKLTSPVLIADIPFKNADLSYVAPLSGSDPVVYMDEGRKRHLVVGGMEAARARRIFSVVAGTEMRIWTPAELPYNNNPPRSMTDICLGLLAQCKVKKVTVPSSFPAGIAADLKAAGIDLNIVKGGLFPARRIKKPAELVRIKACQRAATAGMAAAINMIRGSKINARGLLYDAGGILTSERVKRVVHGALLEHDCMGQGTIVACGSAAADPHETGAGPLRAGQSIVLDIFPRHLEHGYWGDLTRTVVKGEPAPEFRRMYMAVRRAQKLALTHIRAGAVARRIYDLVMNFFNDAGFNTVMTPQKMEGFIHSVGHGLGLEVHEEPRLGLAKNRLRAGEVLTVEPGLYYRDVGGVRIEDVVVVTAEGCRVLHRCPHIFQI